MSVPSLHYNAGSAPSSPRRSARRETEFYYHSGPTQVQDVSGNVLSHPGGYFKTIFKAILATAVFRCWHLILFFTIEAFIVTYLQHHGYKKLAIESTLMNVLGTVLGFVIGYRSSSAFERYNEGRKYWSQIIYNIRMFSIAVWFYVPDEPRGAMTLGPAKTVEEFRARMLVEKKTVLNLLEAYAVALKHYLRGESGSYYVDLYHLIKFLPAYALPDGVAVEHLPCKWERRRARKETKIQRAAEWAGGTIPPPVTSSSIHKRASSTTNETNAPGPAGNGVVYLAPARNPPPYHIFDFWPMSIFVRSMQMNGKTLKGRAALRDLARHSQSGSLPLEITLYLSSYIASVQRRGVDGFATGQMAPALGQMVEALTGLERILHSPIPFSFTVHIWFVSLVWLFALPFQVLKPLGWLTVPGVALASFVYCGLLKCSEELENPFGYDYNDLNLDLFTHNIVRKELHALTSVPMPDPMQWAFSVDNDAVFDHEGNAIYMPSTGNDKGIAASEEWVKRGEADIRAALRTNSDEIDHHSPPPPVATTITSVPPRAVLTGAVGALAGMQMSPATEVSTNDIHAFATPGTSSS